MRIQHNIMSMNAYRNYNTNTSALSRNLEKLSSGYRINRAGDDAAGLAISEKMRAQITGLETAGKNVKDGVSLVKTAEGAMQEVQDMLNRMVELATQSANGTYDNEVDRNNLQQEVDRLKEEIDRIADSANFNGIKLLDGSMTKDGTVAVDVVGAKTSTTDAVASTSTTEKAVLTKNNFGAAGTGVLRISIAFDDGTSAVIEMEHSAAQTIRDKATGKEYKAATDDDAGYQAAAKDLINDALRGKATVAFATDGKMTVTSTETGKNAPQALSITADKGAGQAVIDAGKTTAVAGVSQKITIDKNSITAATGAADWEANVFRVNGQKFVLATAANADAVREAADKDVTVLIGTNLDDTAGQLAAATGLDAAKGAGNNIDIFVSSGKELSLQIGDTSDKYNQMEVGIQDMHVAALGIGAISIAQQDDAQAAVKTIKDAINKVSSVRGTLGATQNRLEHTQKNLSVMAENIQDAEATIRDTDVAAEMMAYTKNNILVQSAQAMLAQANQVPQGVLQLLQ